MAENVPTPPGAPVPPKPAELPKPQAKKETVRINLPPKPTASPTIKLPTLPPGGGSAGVAGVAAPTSAAAPHSPIGAPKPPTPPTPGTGARVSTAAHAPAAPVPAPAPATKAPARGNVGTTQITGLDKGLAVAAAIFSLAALGVVIYLWMFLTNTPGVTE